MLTIVIFTKNRKKYLDQLMSDILSTKLNIKIYIINYLVGERKQFLLKKKYFQSNIKIIYDPTSIQFSKKVYKYIKYVKTKFVWFISDDDRIEPEYIKKLLNFLKKNNQSGYTINNTPFKNEDNILREKIYEIKKIRIKLIKEIHKLGLISSQIFNIEKFNRIKKDLNKNLLFNNGYPHVYIALLLNKKFNDWCQIKNKIVYVRYGNLSAYSDNNKILDRLDYEFRGYLEPLKKIYNDKIYNKFYKKIFFKNIISWILFSLEKNGKFKTFQILKKNRILIPKILSTSIITKILFFVPVKVLIIVKKIKNILIKF